jgi:hypothetical protein
VLVQEDDRPSTQSQAFNPRPITPISLDVVGMQAMPRRRILVAHEQGAGPVWAEGFGTVRGGSCDRRIQIVQGLKQPVTLHSCRFDD